MIPLRIVTMVVGMILGYAAGIYVEISYNKFPQYQADIEKLITVAQGGMRIDGLISSDDEDFSYMINDQCASDTSEDETEYSE